MSSRALSITGSMTTCADVCSAYLAHARRIYVRPDGTPTRHAANVRLALRDLIEQYGDVRANRLHSSHVLAVRSVWVIHGLTRNTINARVRIIVAAWAWAAQLGWVNAGTVAHLRSVRTLQRGHAAEGPGVRGVSIDAVLATLAHVPDHIADLVRLLLLTGCRVGEARDARSDEVFRSETIWALRPSWHKTARHGCARSIVLPADARRLIEPRLGRAYLFGPRDGSTPYHRDAIAQAIYRGCKRAGVPRWSPGQVRHTVATLVYERHGLESTRIVLGHTTDRVTRRYVHAGDERRAGEIVASIQDHIRRKEAAHHGAHPQARAG